MTRHRRVYSRPGDEIPPAASPVYSPPNVHVRVKAHGGMVRGADGKFGDVVIGGDQKTCKEVENELLEIAREEGVPADERHIRLVEVTGNGTTASIEVPKGRDGKPLKRFRPNT